MYDVKLYHVTDSQAVYFAEGYPEMNNGPDRTTARLIS